MRRARLAFAVVVAACGSGEGAPPDAAPADAATTCVAPPDAPTTCGPSDAGCDPFLHCGCGAEQKCTAGTVGLECVPSGAKGAGETCAGDGECARGTVCVPFFGVTQCMRFCDPAHACPSGEACYVIVTDRQQPARQVAEVCGPTCALLAQSCTVSGLGCYVSEKHCQAETGLCLSAGAGTQRDICAKMTDCAAGHLCIDRGGSAPPSCAKICAREGSGPMCDVGTTCRELPGHIQTGICLP
jgi:hypothetical protein